MHPSEIPIWDVHLGPSFRNNMAFVRVRIPTRVPYYRISRCAALARVPLGRASPDQRALARVCGHKRKNIHGFGLGLGLCRLT